MGEGETWQEEGSSRPSQWCGAGSGFHCRILNPHVGLDSLAQSCLSLPWQKKPMDTHGDPLQHSLGEGGKWWLLISQDAKVATLLQLLLWGPGSSRLGCPKPWGLMPRRRQSIGKQANKGGGGESAICIHSLTIPTVYL